MEKILPVSQGKNKQSRVTIPSKWNARYIVARPLRDKSLKDIFFNKNKKGQLDFDVVFYALAILLSTAILIFVIYYAYGQIRTPFEEGLTNALPAASQNVVNMTTIGSQTIGGVGLFDTLYPFLLFGIILMCIVSAMMYNSHPVFFFISIIILAVTILLGVVYSNVYQQITESTEFGSTKDSFSVTTFIMRYLPFIIALLVIIFMIVMFGKPGGQGGL